MIHRIDGGEAWEQVSGEGQNLDRQVGTNPKGFVCPLKSCDCIMDLKGPVLKGVKQRHEQADLLIRKIILGIVNADWKRGE